MHFILTTKHLIITIHWKHASTWIYLGIQRIEIVEIHQWSERTTITKNKSFKQTRDILLFIFNYFFQKLLKLSLLFKSKTFPQLHIHFSVEFLIYWVQQHRNTRQIMWILHTYKHHIYKQIDQDQHRKFTLNQVINDPIVEPLSHTDPNHHRNPPAVLQSFCFCSTVTQTFTGKTFSGR